MLTKIASVLNFGRYDWKIPHRQWIQMS